MTKLIDRLNLDDAGRQRLRLWCYRQAAINFTAVGQYRDAAECWEKAGEVDQAVKLLLEHADCAEAARLMWDGGRYREALDCYQRWRHRAEDDDLEAIVGSQLGVAACQVLLDEQPEARHELYLHARARIEAAELSGAAQVRCWRALGEYGYRVGRWDVINVGYEMALRCLEGASSRIRENSGAMRDDRPNSHEFGYGGRRGEVLSVLREYLHAAEGNRLLVQRLREQLAELEADERPDKPQGDALKAAAGQIGPPRRLEGSSKVGSASFSPDGRLLASGSGDQTVRLWNPDTGQQLHSLQAHTGSDRSVSFSPDGRLLASGSGDQTVRLWNPDTGQQLRSLQGHTDSVWSVSFSPDGRLLASGSSDNTVRLWNPDTGEQLRSLQGHQRTVYAVSFSPDGRLLASGSSDKTVRLWNPDTGQQLRSLQGHTDSVWSVSLSPAGRLLASGSSDKTVRLWNLDTGEELRRFDVHSRYGRCSFSADGRILMTTATEREPVRVWDTETWECLTTLKRDSRYCRYVSVSNDGRFLVSGMSPIEIWDISPLQCGV